MRLQEANDICLTNEVDGIQCYVHCGCYRLDGHREGDAPDSYDTFWGDPYPATATCLTVKFNYGMFDLRCVVNVADQGVPGCAAPTASERRSLNEQNTSVLFDSILDSAPERRLSETSNADRTRTVQWGTMFRQPSYGDSQSSAFTGPLIADCGDDVPDKHCCRHRVAFWVSKDSTHPKHLGNPTVTGCETQCGEKFLRTGADTQCVPLQPECNDWSGDGDPAFLYSDLVLVEAYCICGMKRDAISLSQSRRLETLEWPGPASSGVDAVSGGHFLASDECYKSSVNFHTRVFNEYNRTCPTASGAAALYTEMTSEDISFVRGAATSAYPLCSSADGLDCCSVSRFDSMASHYYSLSSVAAFGEQSAWNAFGQGAPFGVSPSSSGLAFAFDFNFDGMDDVIIGNRIYLSQYADTEQQWDAKRHVGKQFTSFMPKAIDAIRVSQMGTAFCCIAFDDNSVVLYRVEAVPSSSSLQFIFADRLDATGSRGEVTSISMFVDIVHEEIYRAKIGVLVTYSDANDVVFIRKFPMWTTDIEAGYTTKSETAVPIQTTVPVPTLASSASVWPTKIGHTVNGAPSPPPLISVMRYALSEELDFRQTTEEHHFNCNSLSGDGAVWQPVKTIEGCRAQSLGILFEPEEVGIWPDSVCYTTTPNAFNVNFGPLGFVNLNNQKYYLVCESLFEVQDVTDVFFLATPVGFANLVVSEKDGYMQRTLSSSTTENSVAVSSIVLQSEFSSYTVAVAFANDNTQNYIHYITLSSISINKMQRFYDFDNDAYMYTSTFGDVNEETVDVKLVDIDRDSFTDVVTIERSGYARVYRGSAATQERFNFSHVIPEPIDAASARAYTTENGRRMQSQVPGALTGEERFLSHSKLVVGRLSTKTAPSPPAPPPAAPPPTGFIISSVESCVMFGIEYRPITLDSNCRAAAAFFDRAMVDESDPSENKCFVKDGDTTNLYFGPFTTEGFVCMDMTVQPGSIAEYDRTPLTRRERDSDPVKFLITHHYNPNTRGGSCSMRCHEANRMGYDSFKLFDNSIASVDEDDLNLYYQAGEPTRCLCGPRFDEIDAPYVEFELMEPTSTQTSYFNLLTVCPPRTGTRRQRRQHRPPLRHRRRRRRHSRILKHLLQILRFQSYGTHIP